MSNLSKQKCSICGAPDHTHLHCYGTDAQRPVSLNECGWLIEWPADDNVPVRWWHPVNGWMRDASKGVRFSRKQDAEAYISAGKFCSPVVATEHAWGFAPETTTDVAASAYEQIAEVLNTQDGWSVVEHVTWMRELLGKAERELHEVIGAKRGYYSVQVLCEKIGVCLLGEAPNGRWPEEDSAQEIERKPLCPAGHVAEQLDLDVARCRRCDWTGHFVLGVPAENGSAES